MCSRDLRAGMKCPPLICSCVPYSTMRNAWIPCTFLVTALAWSRNILVHLLMMRSVYFGTLLVLGKALRYMGLRAIMNEGRCFFGGLVRDDGRCPVWDLGFEDHQELGCLGFRGPCGMRPDEMCFTDLKSASLSTFYPCLDLSLVSYPLTLAKGMMMP